MESRPELLAPAQDWNSLGIVKGLADAIYFGVQNYNMRRKAKNFEERISILNPLDRYNMWLPRRDRR